MTQQSKQLRRFNRLVGETDAVYHELANRLGLSDSAFQILYTLQSEDGACPLRDICAFSGLTKQTVNSALRKLEAEGSVTTESNEILGSWPAEDLEKYIRLTEEFLVSVRARAEEVHS